MNNKRRKKFAKAQALVEEAHKLFREIAGEELNAFERRSWLSWFSTKGERSESMGYEIEEIADDLEILEGRLDDWRKGNLDLPHHGYQCILWRETKEVLPPKR